MLVWIFLFWDIVTCVFEVVFHQWYPFLSSSLYLHTNLISFAIKKLVYTDQRTDFRNCLVWQICKQAFIWYLIGKQKVLQQWSYWLHMLMTLYTEAFNQICSVIWKFSYTDRYASVVGLLFCTVCCHAKYVLNNRWFFRVLFFYVLHKTHLPWYQDSLRHNSNWDKKIKLVRNSSTEIKVEIVANLLRSRLYKDKTN